MWTVRSALCSRWAQLRECYHNLRQRCVFQKTFCECVYLTIVNRRILLPGPPLLWFLLADLPYTHSEPLAALLLLTSFCILALNFPDVAPSFQKTPLYIENVRVDPADVHATTNRVFFYRAYYISVNLSAVVVATVLVQYAYVQVTLPGGPSSYVEIAGVIGGVCALGNRVQQTIGRVLLNVCNFAQTRHNDVTLPIAAQTVANWPYSI